MQVALPPSLTDRLFFPLVLLVVAGLIWASFQIRPAGQEAQVSADRFLMEGAALAQLIAGPGTQSQFDPGAPGGPFARTTATASLEAAGNMSAGVAAVIAGAFEDAVIGREIEVSFDLRAVDPELTEARIGYFVVGDGDTGWREVPVTTEFQTVSLRHRVPNDAPRGNNDWVGIWPDTTGAGRAVIVRRIEVRILEASIVDGG